MVTPKKRGRGRPPVDSERVVLRAPRDLLDGLDSFIASEPDPKPSRPEAMRLLLRDHLVGLGFIRLERD